MTEKTRRRDLFRPLQLVGLSLLCGLFAGVVTLIATGAFTDKVMRMVDKGTYGAIPPWNLAFIVTGGIFIAALLILSILILAVDPSDFTKPHDRPVLYDDDAESADAAAVGAAAAADAGSTGSDESAAPSDADDADDAPGSGTPSAS
ncbi:hypothetical protein [Microbacterium azadirachtae]|uniref:Uncharacterized protein n=1 Tax=Microbacterium azadirachtae TaxID=582680 RepID=A0A0F0LMI3_9MICO|nr:hypothetical protein [Microbacterium azadirachtae]KJL33899.1 hypothetical protein RS86_01335 [Microbacterium azadirachtae]